MKNYFFYWLLFFIIIAQKNNAQTLFIANSTSGPIDNFIKINKIKRIDFIYQNSFVTNDSYDEAKLLKTIDYMFPNKNQSGMAILDWEGPTFANLSNSGKKGESCRKQFIAAIKKAKQLRPNIKWSYYGIPTREFWNMNDVWKRRNYSLESIVKNCDFLAPSIYIFYSLDEVESSMHYSYIDKNVSLAREMGAKFNKKVYMLVNHRFHPSNKSLGNQLVPDNLFKLYIERIIQDGVLNIVWWNSEDYNYNIRNMDSRKYDNRSFKSEFSDMTREDGISKILNRYLRSLNSIIKR